ncbi:sigma-54 interaction domain-containing protein [Lysinibacillus pakistanensis]|uniref:HTH-type transcriptional regulatory protein TyrR n=1 Tax=Lysinibacillus pakistanensis TaxID=759811 RepID=A0AAX3WV04_9BACI|nr:sigma 54-interacting transcriptional regulator [Lysinibacillus pakistanensis]MDM5231058.1 sigma 54-interacting transcriptional regulator [Lysinibacillus pakistanensis]QGG53737.1 PAS domain-containing protein [Lysinibacillus pakistanensis]WHY46619.1 sigma 54-interacting transcriptional regulator [Lysinibacillus pakistanensis]WHY51632.1 sigma 54-interacting transcriptional regulator [Lysinibacillus pakistanensis]
MFYNQLKLLGVIEWDQNRDVLVCNETAKTYEKFFDDIKKQVSNGYKYFCMLNSNLEINVLNNVEDFSKLTIFLLPLTESVSLNQEIDKLDNLKKELDEVINSSFDGIVISDAKGKIMYQNPAYERITELSTEFCIGKNLQSLVDKGIIDVSASLKAIKGNRAITISQKIKTGKSVLVSAVPIRNKQGEIIKIVNNVRDLTQLNNLETEIQQLEIKNQRIHEELQQLKGISDPKYSIIAHSTQMKDVIDRALRVAQIDSGVLIQGPSGVGKEKIVDLIHRNSIRKDGPLIKINCGAIPESLLESELFGYESGSFTGATKKGKAGLFEAANNGTIFLDEIGEMPLQLQVKLLRILQEREVVRIGGTTPIQVDVRVIAATNRNLSDMIEEMKFREDLYYRLNIIPIKIPPLEQRVEDIIPLIYHFTNNLNIKYGLNRSFSSEVLETFANYKWPGNVRELQNIVERVVLMSQHSEITMDDLQRELNLNSDSSIQVSNSNALITHHLPLKDQIESFEESIIREAIKIYPSIRKAAIALKIDQSTLVRKLQKYKIENHS